MPETSTRIEGESKRPLAELVSDVFERRATRGNRKLIVEMYEQKFEDLLQTIPLEQRVNTAVKIQKLLVKVGGHVKEYGSRFVDFVRSIVVWPMIAATEEFPKDKYYQMSLSWAKSWGAYARSTTKTATAERMSYRNQFLANSLLGAQVGGVLGAVGFGLVEGAKYGTLVGGLQGAAVGAAIGGATLGAIRGGTSLFLRLKDAIIGTPVFFYELAGGVFPRMSIETNVTSPVRTVAPIVPGFNA